MANAILNFHFDFLNPSLIHITKNNRQRLDFPRTNNLQKQYYHHRQQLFGAPRVSRHGGFMSATMYTFMSATMSTFMSATMYTFMSATMSTIKSATLYTFMLATLYIN